MKLGVGYNPKYDPKRYAYKITAYGPEEMGPIVMTGIVVARRRRDAMRMAKEEIYGRLGFIPDHWIKPEELQLKFFNLLKLF